MKFTLISAVLASTQAASINQKFAEGYAAREDHGYPIRIKANVMETYNMA